MGKGKLSSKRHYSHKNLEGKKSPTLSQRKTMPHIRVDQNLCQHFFNRTGKKSANDTREEEHPELKKELKDRRKFCGEVFDSLPRTSG